METNAIEADASAPKAPVQSAAQVAPYGDPTAARAPAAGPAPRGETTPAPAVGPAGPRPLAALAGLPAYRRKPAAAARWRLDANEGARLADLDGRGLLAGERLRRYPDAGSLEARLAQEFALAPENVLATAGADDGLFRACLAYAGGGRRAVYAEPTFEMLTRYLSLAGAELCPVPERGGKPPIEGLLREIQRAGPALGLVALVSPNNPTGSAASARDLERIAAAAPQALLLVDLAYAEYAAEDLTEAALALPNALVLRTFSKAWGLANARVGYVLGPAALLEPLRAAGNPYAVAGPSLALAEQRLERDRGAMRAHVARVVRERQAIEARLEARGARVSPSMANFAFAEVPDPELFVGVAAGRGLALRRFPGRAGLEGAVRIGCPDDPRGLAELLAAIDLALAPEALLFDMDGVLADVSQSQVAAIVGAAAGFGVRIGAAEVAAAQDAGDANCDWELTRRLCVAGGVETSLAEAREAYERAYQGGLFELERAQISCARLEGLAERWPLGIVTGRPRRDAQRFLERFGIAGCFRVLIAREDAALKPDPSGVRLALERLGVERAWMFGDTPDDLAAALAAGAAAIGVLPPGCPDPQRRAALLAARGAARVLAEPQSLGACLSNWLPRSVGAEAADR
jgi:histidinol-phosphate aminotransferase